MNDINLFYGNQEQWQAFAGQFLEGSNQLAAIPIPKIDYRKVAQGGEEKRGYYGALVSAVSQGINKEPLDLDGLMEWRNLIVEEMRQNGVAKEKLGSGVDKKQVSALLEKLNEAIEEGLDEVGVVELLSEISAWIEEGHLFAPVDRRMSHLIMNYLLSYTGAPLFQFTSSDKHEYLSSIHNKLRMNLLLSKKVRQFVLTQGAILEWVGGKYGNDWYKAPDSDRKRDLILERRPLINAARSWEDALKKSNAKD